MKNKWVTWVLVCMLMVFNVPPAQPAAAQAEAAAAAQYTTIARTAGDPHEFTSLSLYTHSLGENGTVAFTADSGAGDELWLWHNNTVSKIFEGIITPGVLPSNLFVGHDGRVAIDINGQEVHVRLPDGTVVRPALSTDGTYPHTHNLDIHTSGGSWLVSQRSHNTVINEHDYVYYNYWLTNGVETSAPIQVQVYDINFSDRNVSDFIFRYVRGITDDGAFLVHEITFYNHQNVGERLFFTGTRNEVLFAFSRPYSNEDTGEFVGRVLLNGVGDVLFEKIPRVNGVPVEWSLMLSQNGGAPVEMTSIDPRTGQSFDRLLGLSATREVLMRVQYGSADYRWMDSFDLSADPVSVPFESLYGQTGSVDLMVNINDSGQKALIGKLADNSLVLLVEQSTRWTILHYMAGDNDLDSSYEDIFQHLESKANLPGVRILVFYDTRDALLGSRYFEILHDTNPKQFATYIEGATVWGQGELNTGDPATLANFIKWGVAYAPAEHYALILDDHGSGLGGLAVDETAGNDWLTLVELRQALSSAYATTVQKMDVLYMAMCLMGMIEDAYQVRGYADYYVASQQLQTTYTNYLTSFDPADAPAEVAVGFADGYANEMAAKSLAATTEYTVSVADLSKLEALAAATNQFGQALAERSAFILDGLAAVNNQVQRYDNKTPKGALTQSDTYVDLHNFAFWTALALPGEANIVTKANAVKAAVDEYIIYERNGSLPPNVKPTQPTGVDMSQSRGVSIFFPGGPSSFYKAANYDFAAGAVWGAPPVPAWASASTLETPTTWGGFVSNYIALTQPGAADDPAPEAPITKTRPTQVLFLSLVARP